MKRKLIIALALCLALALGIGGTMAYLTATTDAVVNTFTLGNVAITLAETEGSVVDGKHQFKMVPGNEIDKDPKVTVIKGSEACWLFVKLTKSDNFDDYLTYTVDNTEWTALPGEVGVYYREVAQNDMANQVFSVLSGDKVVVKTSVTLDEVNNNNFTQPTLTIKAAAIQKANIADAATAFKSLPKAFTGLE